MSDDLITREATLADHANAIRSLGKRVIADIIEIGRRLTDAKRIAGHGNWLPWLEREFGWTDRTALNFMRVHELAMKSETVSDLDIPVRGLYLLAAPSTPDEARAQVIARAEGGEALSVADIARTVDEVRNKQRKTTGKGAQPPRQELKRSAADIEKANRAAQVMPRKVPDPKAAADRAEGRSRQHLDAEFEQRVRDECRKRIEETILPSYNKSYAEYQEVIKARKGIMDKKTFMLIWSCLHPDSRKSVSAEKLNEAFLRFSKMELLLLDEKEHPTPTMQMPSTSEELMALKAKVAAERKTKRDARRSQLAGGAS